MAEPRLRAAAAVVTQFWDTARSYLLLRERRSAVVAMAATVAVIAATGLVPALIIDWDQVDADWEAGRTPELLAQGHSVAAADSVVSSELTEMRGMAESMPLVAIIERAILALLAGLAAFGLTYAIEGTRVGRATDYITSSMLAQGAYMLVGMLVLLLVTLTDLPGAVRLDLSALVPTDTADPSRLHVFAFRFLAGIDLPTVVTLYLWGTGLSAIMDRPRSYGLRLCSSVYLAGLLMVSMPVLFAPSA